MGSFSPTAKAKCGACTSASGCGDVESGEHGLTGRYSPLPSSLTHSWGSAMLGEKKFYRSPDNSECDGRP